MTAAVAHTPRPVLYLVPGGGAPAPLVTRPSPPPRLSSPRPTRAAGSGRPLAAVAAEVAGRVLGTLFEPVAERVAGRFADRVPLPAGRSRPEPWAAAIAFLLAEEGRLFAYDERTTRTSLARELGASLPTLRRRAATVRAALQPCDLVLPDPVPDAVVD